jgi:sarcosine oxidase subunit beta
MNWRDRRKAAGGVRPFSTPTSPSACGLEVLAPPRHAEIDFTRDGYLYLLSDQTNAEVLPESVAQNSPARRAG